MERTLEEWRTELLKFLSLRTLSTAKLRRYYDGDQSLPTAPNTTDEKYRRLARMAVTNMCALVVDAPASKLTPKGVRLSEESAADLDLWREVWKANRLNARCRVAHEEALKVGRSAALVWPRVDDDDAVTGVSVTIEDADQVIVAYEPGDLDTRTAGLKIFTDGQSDFCTVWTSDEVFSWTRKASKDGYSLKGWVDDPDPLKRGVNRLGRVPIVEFLCKPNAKGEPAPELSDAVLHLQDRINKTMFDAVVAAEDGAFPQRYSIGIEMATNADGDPVNPLKTGPNRIWNLVSEDSGNPSAGQIGQLQAFDNAGLLRLASTSIQQLGWISRTSSIFMLGGSSNVGADMIRALDDGHMTKVLAHQVVFGEAWQEVFELALIAFGRPVPDDIEIDWVSPEFRSPAELADAAIKLGQAGYPFEAIARYMGASPPELKRILAEREAATGGDDAADARLLAEIVQKVYLGVGPVLTREEARDIVRKAGVPLAELPADTAAFTG